MYSRVRLERPKRLRTAVGASERSVLKIGHTIDSKFHSSKGLFSGKRIGQDFYILPHSLLSYLIGSAATFFSATSSGIPSRIISRTIRARIASGDTVFLYGAIAF